MPDSGTGVQHGSNLSSLSFGSYAISSHVIPLTIAGSEPAAPEVLLILRKHTTETFPFARYWLYEYDRSKLPIAVQSWFPYRAHVTAGQPAYLETPRMWVKGWRALVNGRTTPVLRSRENLVMMPVEAGASDVVLKYSPPIVVLAAFWLGAAGWLALGGVGLWQLALWSGGSGLRLSETQK